MSGGKDSIELNIRLPAGALDSFSRLAEQLRLLLEGAGPAPSPRAGAVESGVNPNFPEVLLPTAHLKTSKAGDAPSVRAGVENAVGIAPSSRADVATEIENAPVVRAGGMEIEPAPAVRANAGTETGNAPSVRANAKTALNAVPSVKADTEKETGNTPATSANVETKIDEVPTTRADAETKAGTVPSVIADAEIEIDSIPAVMANAETETENAPAVRADAETATGNAPSVQAGTETELPASPVGVETRNALELPLTAKGHVQSPVLQHPQAVPPQLENNLFAAGAAGAVETELELPQSRWRFPAEGAAPQTVRPLTAEEVSLAFRRDERRYDTGFPFY